MVKSVKIATKDHEMNFAIFGLVVDMLLMLSMLLHMTADRMMAFNLNFDKISGLDNALVEAGLF
jgi:hypothetical protein